MKIGKNIKQAFSDRGFKMGGFQTLIMVIVIAVVVVLNLIVGKLDISVDLSSDNMYTLTEDTRNLADTIEDDIVIYYLCQDGQETLNTGTKTIDIEKILKQYGNLKHISVEKKDPVQYPTFAKEYTEEEVGNNDVIVVNTTKNTSKYLSANELIVSQADYTTGSYSYSIDMEGQVTAAIQSLTSGNTKKIYFTSGHGEVDIGSGVTDILGKSNYTTETLETLKKDKVPEDCDILYVNAPQYDFNQDEYDMISTYLKDGGKAVFCLNIQAENTTNYYKLLGEYGINVVKGYVVDSEYALRADVPLAFFPTVNSHDITADALNSYVYMDYAAGMTSQSELRGGLTVESLLDTSESSYSRTDSKEMDYASKVDSDISGPFSLAMAVTDTHQTETEESEEEAGDGSEAESEAESSAETKLMVYSSPDFTVDAVTATNQYGNRSMIQGTLKWLTGEEVSGLAIPARSLTAATVTIESGSVVFWTAALVIVIPLLLLISGFVIWFRRRKR